MSSGASFRDASGHRVNHDLSPLDIQAGGDLQVIWQSLGHSRGEDMGGGKEGVTANTRPSEHNQVPLGSLLCSGNLNIGVGGVSGESGVAGVDQDRGCKSCCGTEG